MTQAQYATADELQQLAISPAAASRLPLASLNAVLQASSSLADSYLASQFTLPLQVSPQGWDMQLKLAVCNIARWMLYNQYGFMPVTGGDQLIVETYKSAIAWLEQIRDKKIFPAYIDSSSSGAPVTADEGGNWIESDPPVGFTTRGVTSNGGTSDPWGWEQ